MQKFRKKPVVISAYQFLPDGEPPDGLGYWPQVLADASSPTGYSTQTLEGKHEVTPGDWIITGVKGEVYPCKDDIFRMTYEPVDEEPFAQGGQITYSCTPNLGVVRLRYPFKEVVLPVPDKKPD